MRDDLYEAGMLQGGHYAMLKFDQGFLTIQVIGSEIIELKPYTLKNSDGTRGQIAANTAGDTTNQIVNSNDINIPEPRDNERGLVTQIMIGVDPERMQIYPFFGRDRNVGSGQEDAEPVNALNWIDGFGSSYDNPSRESEIFYVNDMEPLSLQPFNPMDVPSKAKVSIHINRLRYAVVRDIEVVNDMLEGRIPARKHNMGLGSRDTDQVGTPAWVTENFGENIYTVEEILQADESEDAPGQVPRQPGQVLQGRDAT